MTSDLAPVPWLQTFLECVTSFVIVLAIDVATSSNESAATREMTGLATLVAGFVCSLNSVTRFFNSIRKLRGGRHRLQGIIRPTIVIILMTRRYTNGDTYAVSKTGYEASFACS